VIVVLGSRNQKKSLRQRAGKISHLSGCEWGVGGDKSRGRSTFLRLKGAHQKKKRAARKEYVQNRVVLFFQ